LELLRHQEKLVTSMGALVVSRRPLCTIFILPFAGHWKHVTTLVFLLQFD